MQTLPDGPAYRPLPESYPYAGRDTFWQFPSQLDDDTCDPRFPWAFWSSQVRDDYAERAAARRFDRTELRPVYVGGIPAHLLHSMHARWAPGFDPRHVEAFMRIAHPTLDHLSPEGFVAEIFVACDCIREAGLAESEALARTYGY